MHFDCTNPLRTIINSQRKPLDDHLLSDSRIDCNGISPEETRLFFSRFVQWTKSFIYFAPTLVLNERGAGKIDAEVHLSLNFIAIFRVIPIFIEIAILNCCWSFWNSLRQYSGSRSLRTIFLYFFLFQHLLKPIGQLQSCLGWFFCLKHLLTRFNTFEPFPTRLNHFQHLWTFF